MRYLGSYQLLRKIGSGGMAEVWSARRATATTIGADKFVAIKVLAPHLAQKQEYRDMFLAEARLSMLLSHSNIVQVFDIVEEGDDCYMVMELIEGMTLSQLERGLGKQGRKLPNDVTAHVIAELLRALAYAHEVRTPAGSIVVHRDVSPQNVMVTTSGEVKLMDFGIARFATDETQGVFAKGKLPYMPPEQLKKKTRKPTIDLFAVGGILHELLDGRPFRAKIEETRLLGMVLQGEVPDLTCDLDDVPTELDLLRMWLLEPDEADRLQTANEALEQLYKWPDYRNAAIALKRLVQEFVQPASAFTIPAESLDAEGSFSGVPVPAELRVGLGAAASQSGAAVLPSASQSGAAAARSGGGGQTVSDTHDHTPHEGERASQSEVFILDDDFPRPTRWRVPAVVVLALVVLIGSGIRLFGGAGESEQDEAPPQVVVPAAPVRAEADTDMGGADTDMGGADRADPDSATSELEEEPEPEPEVADKPRVPVEFVANEFFFVYVKVGGKVMGLEPRARITLPVGRHSVYLRQTKTGEWQRAGRIDIEAGEDYRVEMRKPADLKLVKK